MYPKDFIDDVRDEFGDRDDVMSLVEGGRYVLGKVLADEARTCLDPEEVVRLFEEGRQEEVLASARRAVRRRELHRRWLQFMLHAAEADDPDRGARAHGS